MNPHNRNQQPPPPRYNHQGGGRGPSQQHNIPGRPSANAEMIAPGMRQQRSYHLAQQERARKLREEKKQRSSIQQFQPHEQPFAQAQQQQPQPQMQRPHIPPPPNQFSQQQPPPHHPHNQHHRGGPGRGGGPPPPQQPRYPHHQQPQQQRFGRKPNNHQQRENNQRHPPPNAPPFRREDPRSRNQPSSFSFANMAAARPPPQHQGVRPQHQQPPQPFFQQHRPQPQQRMYRSPKATEPLAVTAAAAVQNQGPQNPSPVNNNGINNGQQPPPQQQQEDDESAVIDLMNSDDEGKTNATNKNNDNSRARSSNNNNNNHDNGNNNRASAANNYSEKLDDDSDDEDIVEVLQMSRAGPGTSAASATGNGSSQQGMLKQSPSLSMASASSSTKSANDNMESIPRKPAAFESHNGNQASKPASAARALQQGETLASSDRGQVQVNNDDNKPAAQIPPAAAQEAPPAAAEEEAVICLSSDDDEESDDDDSKNAGNNNLGAVQQTSVRASSSSSLFPVGEQPDETNDTGSKDDATNDDNNDEDGNGGGNDSSSEENDDSSSDEESVTASQQKKRLAMKSAGRKSAGMKAGRKLFTPPQKTTTAKPVPVRRTKVKRQKFFVPSSEEEDSESDSEEREFSGNDDGIAKSNSSSSQELPEDENAGDDSEKEFSSSLGDESVGEKSKRRKQTARKTAMVKFQPKLQRRSSQSSLDSTTHKDRKEIAISPSGEGDKQVIDVDSAIESSDENQGSKNLLPGREDGQRSNATQHSSTAQAQGSMQPQPQYGQQQLGQNRQPKARIGQQQMAPYPSAFQAAMPLAGYAMMQYNSFAAQQVDGEQAVMQARADLQQVQGLRQKTPNKSNAPVNHSNRQDHKKKRNSNDGAQRVQKLKKAKKKRTSSDSESEAEFCGSDASSEIECEVEVKSPSPFGVRRPKRRREHVDYTFPSSAAESPGLLPTNDDDDDDDDGAIEMSKAKHVVEMNPETGRPVGKITCYGGGAEILYDFRVDIEPSLIPNSGMGAFLTFLGARHLKAKAYGKKGATLSQKPLELEDSLEAVGEDGYGIHLTLKGDSLDETKTVRPDGIGPERNYTESDYEDSAATVFSSKGRNNGLIELGRYGPFTPRDRIPTHHFDVKSFVLGYEPSEWCFGVEENLFGREEQIIDITDNLTGKTHALAQRNLPMYVNEVGHNPALTQNVSSRTRNDRSVHYYIDIDRPMKKGQKVELLTNYDDTYEDIRLRKGYGKMSLEDGVGDDSDPKELLIRNCDLRGTIVLKIRELGAHRTYLMIEYIEESIHAPIRKLIKQFIEDTKNKVAGEVPLSRQWVALLRLQWVGGYVLKHLVGVEERLKSLDKNISSTAPKTPLYPWKSMIDQCKEWASGMKSVSFMWEFLEHHHSLCDPDGNNILPALKAERVEAMWYECNAELRAPLNASVWCPVAFGLIEQLSGEVETNTLTVEPTFCINPKKIISAAVDAAEKVKEQVKSFPENSVGLEFEAGVPAGAHASAKQLPTLCKRFFEGNTQNPKGVLAGLFEIQAYMETSYLLDDHRMDPSFSVPVAKDARIVMTRFDGFKDESQLASIPKSVDATKEKRNHINETWYVVWQVIFVANAIAEHYLPRGREGDLPEEYSLEKLCAALEVDLKVAQGAIEERIQDKSLKIHTRKKSSSGSSRKSSSQARKKAAVMSGTKIPKEKTGGNNININAFGQSRPAAIEIGTGPPDEEIVGGWPAGWVRKVFERQSGASKGHRDRYWYSPRKEYKFRSMKEVKTFLSYLRMVGGDEVTAHKMFKEKK